MRFVSALLFVALTGSIAVADEAKPADPKPEVTKRKVPLRVVKMLPETRQVLLFDKNKGTHVVAEVGQDVDGYVVDDIDGDEVSLVSDSGAQVILTAPEHGHARAAKAAKAKASAGKPTTDPAPVDPYADPAEASVTPAAAPTAPGETGVRVAEADGGGAAPVDPYANLDPGVAAFVKAVGAGPDTAPATASPDTAPTPASPTKTDAAPPAAPATVAPGPTTASISRAEVNAAIGDFTATAATFRATFTGQGLRFDDLHAGSLLAKIGLQKGDIVTTIDGQPLRSLDDAANLYVRLPTAHGMTLNVLRAGKPVTLRVAIQ